MTDLHRRRLLRGGQEGEGFQAAEITDVDWRRDFRLDDHVDMPRRHPT